MKTNVHLRQLRIEDAEISYKWRNNPQIWKYTPYNPGRLITPEIEREWLINVLNCKDQRRFAICVQPDDKYIGNVQLLDINDVEAELHLFIGEPDYWGMGIGEAATTLTLDYAFHILNLSRVKLTVDKDNLTAIRLYKKQGFIETTGTQNVLTMEVTLKDFQTTKLVYL